MPVVPASKPVPAAWLAEFEALLHGPSVTLAQAREMSLSVAGLARLSGFSRMHVHRLVKAGRVVLGSDTSLRWSWCAAEKNYPGRSIPLFRLRKNHPARRYLLRILRGGGLVGKGAGERGADMRTLRYIAQIYGEPNPSPEELNGYIAQGRKAESSNPGLVRPVGVERHRKQAPFIDVLNAISRIRGRHEAPSLRRIGSELGVNASSLSRWFAPGGHLCDQRVEFLALCEGEVSGKGQRRNKRALVA